MSTSAARPGPTPAASRTSLPSHIRPKPTTTTTITTTSTTPNSPHMSDPFLTPFLDPSFDPVAYLNATLPPLQSTRTTVAQPSSKLAPVPLAELSSQATSAVTQFNAQTTRLAATLTQLTDDVLRSGARLAYEVELLRGEALSLSETLSDGLRGDIAKFVPAAATVEPSTPATSPDPPPPPPPEPEPAHVAQLRTLALVRARLDSVIRIFGDAIEFVFPPSEVSVSSGFLSVSAPDPGREAHSTEEKGQLVLRGLREEISTLLSATSDGGDPVKGVEDATRRVEQLKDLSRVWQGTAEEKGRAKFIESLARLVEDRHRELLREAELAKAAEAGGGKGAGPAASAKKTTLGGDAASSTESRGYGGGYGFMSQLQKIRGGL